MILQYQRVCRSLHALSGIFQSCSFIGSSKILPLWKKSSIISSLWLTFCTDKKFIHIRSTASPDKREMTNL